jgi:hypothetical protein
LKLKLKKVIEMLCLITLAIIITASVDYRMSMGQTTLSNFTIPSNNQDETAGPANTGISGSSSSGEKQASDDIVLLNQRYNSGQVFDKIAGEVLNNGSENAEFVKVTASFYDGDGAILGSEMTYAYPSTINPGDKSPFNVFITNDAVKNATETYGFTLQWRGINGTDQSVQITGYQSQDSESSSDNDNIGNNDSIMDVLIRSMATERE